MKPFVIDMHAEKCAKCGFYVKKAYGLETYFEGPLKVMRPGALKNIIFALIAEKRLTEIRRTKNA